MSMALEVTTAGRTFFTAVAVLAITGFAIWILVWAAHRPAVPKIGPTLVFFTSILYLILLLAAIVLYNDNAYSIQQHLPSTVGNTLPLAVPWFGALGAVILSLQGVFDYNNRWDYSYGFWHMARPLFGGTLAIVAYLIFVTIIQTAGAEPATTGDQPAAGAAATIANPFIYYILAFLVGYREGTFRDLITKAADVILGPGTTKSAAVEEATKTTGPSVGLSPSLVDHGSVTPGSVSVVDVELTNSSDTDITVNDVTTSAPPQWQVVAADVPGKTWWSPGVPQQVADGGSLWIRTRWEPPADTPGESLSRATLTVTFTGFEGSPKTAVLTGKVQTA